MTRRECQGGKGGERKMRKRGDGEAQARSRRGALGLRGTGKEGHGEEGVPGARAASAGRR